jgi:hypothetical protein
MREEFHGHYQLDYNYTNHIDSWNEYNRLQEITTWFQFGQKTILSFYRMNKLLGTKLRAWTPEQKEDLYLEFMTLDASERTTSRRIIGLWDVFGKVGGTTHVFTIIAALFFT